MPGNTVLQQMRFDAACALLVMLDHVRTHAHIPKSQARLRRDDNAVLNAAKRYDVLTEQIRNS